MTSVKNEFNPISIEQRVKKNLEQKHSGVSLPDAPTALVTVKAKDRSLQENIHHSDSDLPTEFLNLLFAGDLPNSSNQPSTHQQTKTFDDSSRKPGTNSFFSPLNKQEDSFYSAPSKEKNFCMTIESSDFGSLKLNGKWDEKKLVVHLDVSKSLDLQQKKMLASILEKRLSHELGVTTEIVID